MQDTFSVAICTYNRSALLQKALEAMAVQTQLPDELIVVDNGSTDDTPTTVQHWLVEAPFPVRYVQEPKVGIAYARNRALHEARGKYIAFVDDDAWPDQAWLEELLHPLRTHRNRLASVVGKVVLQWEQGEKPQWMPAHIESLLCAYDLGDKGRFLREGEYLLTTNVLFHRQVVLDIGGFRPYLGRQRGRMLGGEDNDIHQRLIRNGHRIFYQPTAVVHHRVGPNRQTRRFVIKRLFWDGATQPLLAVSRSQEQGSLYHPWQESHRDLRRCGRLILELISNLLRGRSQESWESLLVLVQKLGRLRTNLTLSLASKNEDLLHIT